MASAPAAYTPTSPALRQVLAQQAIGILVGAALPRAVRIGKEDLDRKPLCQALVLAHLRENRVLQPWSSLSQITRTLIFCFLVMSLVVEDPDMFAL